MKQFFLIIMCCTALSVSAQPPKNVKSDTAMYRDSIPAMPDSADFVNNIVLANVDYVIKKVMTSKEWIVAGDPISQYQLLITNLNELFLSAKKRWLEQHTIKVKK